MGTLRFLDNIHRHTGGLEKICIQSTQPSPIHRHTGGLESQLLAFLPILYIHRHTGGLEIFDAKALD